MLVKIPLDDLHSPKPYTKTRVGFIYAFEFTIPVIATINPTGTTIVLRCDGEVLGTELVDVSDRLTAVDVKLLCKGKEVKL